MAKQAHGLALTCFALSRLPLACHFYSVSVEAAENNDVQKLKCDFLRMSSSIKREKRPPSPEDDDDDDVIILSDDSPSPPMNGFSHFKELDTDLLMVS